MSNRSKSKRSRPMGHEDPLADVEPLLLSEFEVYGDPAVELVLRHAARMVRNNEPYRARLVEAIRLYIRCDQVPHVVMALNKRILAAADRRRRDDAMTKVTDPEWVPRGDAQCVEGRT